MSFRRLAIVAAAAVLALLATFASAGIPQTAHSRAELARLGFGYPVRFVFADLSTLDPPRYPESVRLNPWEDPAEIHAVPFLASWLTGFSVLYLLLTGFRRGTARGRKRLRPTADS